MNQSSKLQLILLSSTILLSFWATISQATDCEAEKRVPEKAEFLKSFLKHLNKSDCEQNENFLTIELKGSSEKFVSIEFKPETPAQQAAWSSLVDLIARTLVTLIEKSKLELEAPEFIYSVPFKYFDQEYGYGPQLSIAALKIAAG